MIQTSGCVTPGVAYFAQLVCANRCYVHCRSQGVTFSFYNGRIGVQSPPGWCHRNMPMLHHIQDHHEHIKVIVAIEHEAP